MPWDIYSITWFGLLVFFIVAEAATVSVVSIWFAFGAAASLIAAMVGAALWLQIVIFVVVSALSLYFTRPIIKKYLKVGQHKTNVAAIIGKRGIVMKSIFPNNYGQVKIGGQYWTAKGIDDIPISLNEEVEVIAIEGVKLIVKNIVK